MRQAAVTVLATVALVVVAVTMTAAGTPSTVVTAVAPKAVLAPSIPPATTSTTSTTVVVALASDPIQAPSIAAAIAAEPTAWPNIADTLPYSTAPELTPLQADQQAWEQGFLDSGAPAEYLPAFWRIGGIVDCETDFRNVHSSTGDAGYAQVNQIHRDLIADVTGEDWFTIRLDPYWNGYISGVLVKRKADRGSNPYGDWYRSGHCHGLA